MLNHTLVVMPPIGKHSSRGERRRSDAHCRVMFMAQPQKTSFSSQALQSQSFADAGLC